MYQLFLDILSVLLTVGGVGVINYIIAEQLNAIDTSQAGSNREKFMSLIFSMLDLFLFLLVRSALISEWHLSGNLLTALTIVITVVISLIISFTGSIAINKLFYKLINFERNSNGLSLRRSATNWQSAFALNGTKNQLIYLYDFNHQPLGFGWRKGISNDKESNYSISFIPQLDNDPETQDSYDEVTKLVQQDNFRKDFEVTEYVNFQQKFIAIICNSKDDEN